MTRTAMRILIAPDKFKGSLSARGVAQNIAAGLREVLSNAKIDIVPMADGGEGTAEVICDALEGLWVTCKAHGPLGREIDCRYAYIGNRKLAIMEMSEAAGMRRLQPDERDVAKPGGAGQLLQSKAHSGRKDTNRRSWATQPIEPIGCPPGAMRVDLASTFGVGEMIFDATRHGALGIIIGLGGSATNDGGFGMARALGFRFLEEKREVTGKVSELATLERIVGPGKVVGVFVPNARLKERRSPRRAPLQLVLPEILAAADVRNPLLGANGATRVFGPQKGATEHKIDILERALTRLADVVSKDLGVDFRDEPGAGAAGGLGFGLMSFCDAKNQPGFDVVAEAVELKSKMKNVDLVITGEGSLDRQTLEGKTPAGVARLARKLGKRVFAIVGRASEDRQVREIFDQVYVTTRLGMSEEESIARVTELLRERARELANAL